MQDLSDYKPEVNSLGCYNDALAGHRLRAQATRPNYGVLMRDDASEAPYITDVATGLKLYKHDPCRICGVSEWRWSSRVLEQCMACAKVERNDNE
jgi:hypothetical protein